MSLYTTRSIVFLPYWVEEVLHRHGLNVADALDYQKIRKYLTPEDMTLCLALNNMVETIVGKTPLIPVSNDNAVASPVLSGNLHWFWGDLSVKEGADRAFYSSTIAAPSYSEAVRNELNERLFSPESREERFTDPLIIYDATPDAGIVVVYPGFFLYNGSSDELYLRAIMDILQKSLYVYAPVHEVARTEWFKRYLELLARQRRAA